MMPILVLPNWLIQRLFVRPARFHAAGTMLVGALALPPPSLPLAQVGACAAGACVERCRV